MKETYKNFLGKVYSVSNLGNVRNNKTGELLKQFTNNSGYKIVNIYGTVKLVHRLVAQTFIPNPNNLSDVNHKNEIKTDNRVENLEWLSHKDNMNYGACQQRIHSKANINKRCDANMAALMLQLLDPTLEIKKKHYNRRIVVDDVEYPTTKDATKALGVTKSRISQLQHEGKAYYLESVEYQWVPSIKI